MSMCFKIGAACAAVSLMASAGLAQENKDSRAQTEQQRQADQNRARADRPVDQKTAWSEQPGEMQRWLSKFAGRWDVTVESTGPLHTDAKEHGTNTGNRDTNPASTTGSSETTQETASTGERLNVPHGGATGGGLGSTTPDDQAAKDRRVDGVHQAGSHTGQGKMKTVMMFEGRHAHSWVRAECDGKTYEGMGVMAYNNAAKRFEHTWTDNMNTGVMFKTGQLDADRKTLTLTGDGVCPETGSTVRCREVVRWVSDNQYVTELYHTGSDGTENRKMTLTFVRSAKADMDGDWTNPWTKTGATKEKVDASQPNR